MATPMSTPHNKAEKKNAAKRKKWLKDNKKGNIPSGGGNRKSGNRPNQKFMKRGR